MKHISELQQDKNNANRGTERGQAALKKSLAKYGTGRSILVDKHGRIIAGNKTAETVEELGIDKIQVVKTKGDKLIVVQRTDLDLDTDKAARELAYADNRTGEVNLEWNVDQLQKDIENNLVDLEDLFSTDEIENMIARNSFNPGDIEPKEIDEDLESEIVFHECPKCGHKWPKDSHE